MQKFLVLIPIFLLLTLSVVNAELFKWIDADGKAHYSDSIPAHTKRSRALKINSALGLSSGFEELTLVEESPDIVETVDLYTTSWCPYCVKARAFLRANNVPFKDYDIEKDTNAARRKRQLDSGSTGVPLAVIKGKVIRGFSENAYQRALNK